MEKIKGKTLDRPKSCSQPTPLSEREFSRIKNSLVEIFEEHHREENLGMDPVGWLDRELSPRDLEIISFVLAGISYGRVEQIQKSFEALLRLLQEVLGTSNGKGIYQYLMELNSSESRLLKKQLSTWKHRLNNGKDLYNLFLLLNKKLCHRRPHLFSHYAAYTQKSPEQQIAAFCESFVGADRGRVSRSKWSGTGVEWFFSNPKNGSSCKRLMMWLRWMIREDSIDIGLWNSTQLRQSDECPSLSSRLIIPVDTHSFRWAKMHQIVTSSSANWRSAMQITDFLKRIDPVDPIRFDFAICHAGKMEARLKR